MRIGLFVGTLGSGETLEAQVQQIVDAERDGFDSFWVAQVARVDAMTLFAVAGQRTRSIQMGTAVVPIFTRHPIVTAQQALTTHAATSWRFNLGIGLSHKPAVENRFGMNFDRPALRMKEYLTILRSLVYDGKVDFHGRAYSSTAEISVPSAMPFPILVAALGPRMLEIAGTLAEGTITWMVGPHTLETHTVPLIQKAAMEAGRSKPRVCVGVPIAVTDDKAGAIETARERFGHYGELSSYRRMLDMEGFESPADVAIVGNEREVEAKLRQIASAGATELLASVFPVGDDEKASVARTQLLLRTLVGKI